MPLAAGKFTDPKSPNYTPFPGLPPSTPDGVIIRTPSLTGNSPSQEASPHDKPSPLSAAVTETMALDRARLFLQGRFNDLAKAMKDAEKATMSTWLYQFWMFAFMTSKHWGKGPREWTSYTLEFDIYERLGQHPSPASPALIASSPVDVNAREDNPEIRMPSQLCRWSIHIDDDQFYDWVDADDGPGNEYPQAREQSPLEERLQNALENNDFSNIGTERLPLAIPQIVRAVKKSPKELILESFSFSIMARNEQLLEEMLMKVHKANIDAKPAYPLHIATSYLDGSSTCCNILDRLCLNLLRPRRFYTNDHGHTVLDNLMLTILKGHSNTSLDIIDESLTRESRFAGIEVDLCGRWDADSPCFRTLLQSGKTKVPLSWKHKFCHTSILAVCHCIDALGRGRLLGESSGLFLRRCFNCGLSLQLSPFHVLVLTAFQLARSGCEGEDLFGMIAVLLCMLANGMDLCIRAPVSIHLLLGIDDGTCCTHEDLRPIDLAERLPSKIINGWSAELRRGWQIFCLILRPFEPSVARSLGRELSPEDFDIDSTRDSRGNLTGDCLSPDSDSTPAAGNFPSECNGDCSEFSSTQYAERGDIGHVWAAIQTELLSYRRINEPDSWLSPYFDLDALLTGLQTGQNISMPLLDKGMIKPYCRCGRWEGSWGSVLRERVAAYYFSNMDIWDRTSFI